MYTRGTLVLVIPGDNDGDDDPPSPVTPRRAAPAAQARKADHMKHPNNILRIATAPATARRVGGVPCVNVGPSATHLARAC